MIQQGRQIPDLYDLQMMLPDGSHIICMIQDIFPELDLYYTDPTQHLRTAGQDLQMIQIVIYLIYLSDACNIFPLFHVETPLMAAARSCVRVTHAFSTQIGPSQHTSDHIDHTLHEVWQIRDLLIYISNLYIYLSPTNVQAVTKWGSDLLGWVIPMPSNRSKNRSSISSRSQPAVPR